MSDGNKPVDEFANPDDLIAVADKPPENAAITRSSELPPGVGIWLDGKAQSNSGYGGSDKPEGLADDQGRSGAEH